MRRRPPWKPALLFLLLGLVTTLVVAVLLALFVEVRQGPATAAERYDADGRWSVTRWDRAGAVQIESTRQRSLDWGPEQAAGEPDTLGPGDRVTAWASLAADAGTEWLVLHFDASVIARELHVYENDAPGALVRVTSVDDGGGETELWSGTDPSSPIHPTTRPSNGVAISKIPLAIAPATNRIKIYLACERIPGWNEIDAVALVSDTGVTQWARDVQASSTYASNSGRGGSGGTDPTTLVPAWVRADRPSPAFANRSTNRDERLIDARGWPLLALSSEKELSPGNPSPTPAPITGIVASSGTLTLSGQSAPFGSSGTLVLTTPTAPGVRPPLPTRPIWFGLIGDTALFALLWWLIRVVLTVPRRFVRDVARMRRGACVQCGYDLGYDFIRGCPECGWRRGPADRPGTAS